MDQITPEHFEDPDDLADYKPKWQILKGVVAAIAILGIVYMFGVDQYLTFRKTPDTAQQPVITSQVAGPEIVIPLRLYVVKSDIQINSTRDIENVEVLVEKSNNIWQQASIRFTIESIEDLPLAYEQIDKLNDTPLVLTRELGLVESDSVAVYLTGTYQGVNGISFGGGSNTILVADYTTVNDFRTLAHELGHVLALGHVSEAQYLMASGVNGTELSIEEIENARSFAQQFIVGE